MATIPTTSSPLAPYSGGAFGTQLPQLANPQSIYQELNSNVPNYGALTKTATGNIGNELNGVVSPSTQNMLQNKSAALGISSGAGGFGTPGGFASNNFLQNLGLTSEGLTHQGLTDYNTFTGTAGIQQLDPSLAYGVSEQNAVNAASPDPAAASNYAQMLFEKYMGGNSPSSSTGAFGVSNPKVGYVTDATGHQMPEPVM